MSASVRVLTRRQVEVLRLAANGNTSAEIGNWLGVSANAVNGVLAAAYRALGVSDRAHAVAVALRVGLLRPGDVRVPEALRARLRPPEPPGPPEGHTRTQRPSAARPAPGTGPAKLPRTRPGAPTDTQNTPETDEPMTAQHSLARDSRGHFVPLSAVPLHLDPDTWDDTCTHTTERTPTMTRELPHDPYITAVTDALTAAGLQPDNWWTSDAEINRYDGDGLTTQLDALLDWGPNHPALNTEAHEDGIVLIWEHPAERWQWAPHGANGRLDREPEFLPNLGRYADPAAIVLTVRALLAGVALPEGHAAYWHPADAVRAAVEAWAAE